MTIDSELADKERKLEHLRVEKDIEDEKAAIAEKKAMTRKMNKVEGRDWKHMFGSALKSVRPNKEAIHDMYSINPDLRDMSRPKKF